MRPAISVLLVLLGFMPELGLAHGAIHLFTEPEPAPEPDASIRTRPPGKTRGCRVKPAEFEFVAQPGGESKRIKIGKERYFRISLPLDYRHGEPLPLILAIHDQNMTALELEKASLLSHRALNKNAIVIYPEAKEDTRWKSSGIPSEANDIRYINTLLDRISDKLCVDEDRVYAVGLGIGGGMVHLLACSNLSSRIAAFSIVNGNIFSSEYNSIGKASGSATPLWTQCNPQRSFVRIQMIHSENNTIFDHMGIIKHADRPRQPTVQHVVEWARRNGCGQALGMPEPWRDKDDHIYKTALEQGYIFEGFIEEGAVLKATYHCWPSDQTSAVTHVRTKKHRRRQEDKQETSTASSELQMEHERTRDRTDVNKQKDSRPKHVVQAEFTASIRRNVIQEHLYIRNAPHGWYRAQKIRNRVDVERKAKNGVANIHQPPPEWMLLETTADSTGYVDMNRNDSIFDHGYMEPVELDRIPYFDTTAAVLGFFRMYRLSDVDPIATKDFGGLTEGTASKLINPYKLASTGDDGNSDYDNNGIIPVIGDAQGLAELEDITEMDGIVVNDKPEEKEENWIRHINAETTSWQIKEEL